MVTTMRTFALAFAIVLAFAGCTTTEAPDVSAELLTMDELTKSPGYTWFVAEMDTYTPNANVVSEISTTMTSAPGRKVCVFVKPTCSCRGTQRLFPQVMKTLMAANIEMSRVEVWSMRGATDKHPYQPTILITDLPAIFVLEDGAVRSIVSDQDYTDTNADSLIARAVR